MVPPDDYEEPGESAGKVLEESRALRQQIENLLGEVRRVVPPSGGDAGGGAQRRPRSGSRASKGADAKPEPGDITIAEIPGGYIVGRLLGGRAADALWRHIASTRSRRDACRLACREAEGRRVWQSLGAGGHELVDCSNGSQRSVGRPPARR
jgi:hypothetical protein